MDTQSRHKYTSMSSSCDVDRGAKTERFVESKIGN